MQRVPSPETAELQLVDLLMAAVKELSACWLVEMAAYIADNPQFVVSGFSHAGIPQALDGNNNDCTESIDDNENNMLAV